MNKEMQDSKRRLYAIVAILAIASLAYRFIAWQHLDQSNLLFVGLPALITVMVIKFTGTPNSTYGIVFKVITLFLLMSGILLGEGIACILMAAPLFYGISALVIYFKDKLGRNRSSLEMFVLLPSIVFGSYLSNSHFPNQSKEVSVKRDVLAGVTLEALNQKQDFDLDLPLFFRMGFPKPKSISGSGIDLGDYRKIQFESKTKGIGELHLVITESDEDRLTFRVKTDDTHISHWLNWDEVSVVLISNDNGSNSLEWRTNFTCQLSPSWYFEPIEKYAVIKSSEYLLDLYFNDMSCIDHE